jgi:peptidyl-prolyl cis-trans isomerase D
MLLKSIKENSKGVVTYVIVGLISLTFIITALYGIDFSGSSNVVAIVNDDEISQDDFRSEFNAKKRRLQQELAEKYTAEFDNALKQSTLESMINRRLLNQLASELGYATTGRELQTLIRSNNVFKIDGKFSLEKYKQMLRLNGYSDTQYETVKSTELTQGQIKYNLLNSAFVTPYALQNLSKLNNQQRKFSYIKLSADQYKGKVRVDINSVKEYYDKQTESFFEPQKIKVDFIELSLSDIAKDINVNDDDLFNFYEDEKERFTTEEERQAQHILVESEQQAEQIITQLNSGADFTKLAETHSLDTGSKDAGGDLGFFTLGVMMSEFEDKVFSMKVGEVSSPVKTEFGYHVIKLNNIQIGTVKPFDEIRVELSELYTQRAAQKSLYDLTEQLTNLAYEASLEEASDQMNLKLNTSEFFAQNSTEFEPKFVSVAYGDLVLNKGENSDLIELSKDKFVVLRVKDKLAQRQKLFDEVKGEINTRLTTLLSKNFIDNIAKQITDLLSKGDNKAAQVLIDKNQLKWKEVGWINRDSDKVDIVIVNQVFALPKPTNATTYSAQSLNKRQSIVIALSTVKTADDISTKALERSLLSFESDVMFNGILTTLRKNADLEIFAERL